MEWGRVVTIRLDNIHLTLPNGAIFSIACIDGRKYEVAVMDDNGFVPVSKWYCGDDNSPNDYGDDVKQISNSATEFDLVLDTAIRWAERTI